MDRFERQNPDEPVRGDLQLPGPLPIRPTAIGLMHFARAWLPIGQKTKPCGRNCRPWTAHRPSAAFCPGPGLVRFRV